MFYDSGQRCRRSMARNTCVRSVCQDYMSAPLQHEAPMQVCYPHLGSEAGDWLWREMRERERYIYVIYMYIYITSVPASLPMLGPPPGRGAVPGPPSGYIGTAPPPPRRRSSARPAHPTVAPHLPPPRPQPQSTSRRLDCRRSSPSRTPRHRYDRRE